MPQMTTADVTYTNVAGTSFSGPSDPMRSHAYTILFPNSTNVLYTNGGIPLSPGKLGCPATLINFIIMDAASTTGYVPKWDSALNTIRLYAQQTTAVTGMQLLEVSTAATVASVTLRVIAKGW